MRNKLFIRILSFALMTVLGVGAFVNCGSSGNSDGDGAVDVSEILFSLPSQIEAEAGSQIRFRVLQKKAPLQTDEFLFGSAMTCKIESVSESEFYVRVPQDAIGGKYEVMIRRGQKKKSFGETTLSITQKSDPGFTPDKGTTVWGHVICDGEGVADVVVSDGDQVTKTNSEGIYQLNSAKKWGYVFISVPSGYEVPSKGILPAFYSYLTAKATQVEQRDFSLTKVGSQDKYKMFFLGDMHLANRTSDKAQFRVFTRDLTNYMAAHSSEKMYGMTLGDMTWDLYWYRNKFSFPEYLEEINADIKGLQIYHTMGNHDNDYMAFNDFDAATSYVKYLGPTFYSFNIGKIHYVVLDDIDCSSYDGTTNRRYVKNLSSEQIEWLKKDLAYVSKSTPLIVTTHAQIFYPIAGDIYKIDHSTDNTRELLSVLNGYKVHFVTGHTHVIFNVNPAESKTFAGNEDTYEHNSGSICGSWWWSGSLTSGVYIGTDGSPAGYAIWDIDGTDIKWKFKATAWDESYQFRSYDLNQVSFSYSDVPNMPKDNDKLTTNGFGKYVDAYPKNSKNEVLLNIWNWNSKWTLSVTDESGKELNWTRTSAYDPLHIAALSVKKYNSSTLSDTPSFVTERWHHFFKVTAPDADTDLTIKVTDEFGNVYTETMRRPKAFNVDDFAKK